MTRRLDPSALVAMRESATIELGGTRLDPKVLADFADRHHIMRIALFGSTLRGEDRPDSDVDLLVQFEPDHTPGFLALVTMEAELSVLLGGRRVDLRTAADLSRHSATNRLPPIEVARNWNRSFGVSSRRSQFSSSSLPTLAPGGSNVVPTNE